MRCKNYAKRGRYHCYRIACLPPKIFIIISILEANERDEYFKLTGLAYWQAWIEEYDNHHYLVQCHNMRGDFAYFCAAYETADTHFSHLIADGFKN
jgi:hypothetical protein